MKKNFVIVIIFGIYGGTVSASIDEYTIAPKKLIEAFGNDAELQFLSLKLSRSYVKTNALYVSVDHFTPESTTQIRANISRMIKTNCAEVKLNETLLAIKERELLIAKKYKGTAEFRKRAQRGIKSIQKSIDMAKQKQQELCQILNDANQLNAD